MGGREVVGETKTEIVHVVGECGGLCQLATVSQGIDFFLKRWKPVDGQRAPAIGVDPADDRIVPEYWSGMLNLRVERCQLRDDLIQLRSGGGNGLQR